MSRFTDLFNFKKMFCGIGTSIFLDDAIIINNYPFEPSIFFTKSKIDLNDSFEICYETFPPFIKIANEIVFITSEKKDELKSFALRNKIPIFKSPANWDYILEPYLDTEFSEEQIENSNEYLNKNGIGTSELKTIRNEVGKQMMRYNFDTMLWEWVNLGLSDVLSAMRKKYNKQQFEIFYFKAMEIEMRTGFK